MSHKSDTKQEIEQLLVKIDQTYWGPEERAMIDQALALSQQIGDEELEYRVRHRLTASAARTGDNDTMLSSFAWCLAKYDADPRRFPNELDSGAADLMWQFKWMIGALDHSPIFTLAQCEAMLDDMEAHYRRAGLGLSGVLYARFAHAWETGQIDQAKQLRELLTATERDDHSHCDACGRSELAGFAMEIGEQELALKLVDEIIEGGYSCGEEPEQALARTLIAKLRAGRLDDARDSHLRSYRLARQNPDNISIVADNLTFCAVTGNPARGLALVERHIAWLAHDALNESGQLSMLAAIGVVLESVIEVGHGEQVVRGAAAPDLVRFFGAHDGPWTVQELAPAVWAAAASLSSAFDVRNGNLYVSGEVAQTKGLLSEKYDLPIVTDVFLPPTTHPARPTTPQQWLDLGEACMYANQPQPAIEAVLQVVEAADATPAQRSRALQLLIGSYLEVEDEASAQCWLPARVQSLRDEGRTILADLEERVGLALFGLVSAQAAAALEAELTRLEPGEALADVEVTLAALIGQLPDSDPDRERELLEAAAAHAVTRPSLRASALFGLFFVASRSDLEQAHGYADQILAMEVSDGCRAAVLRERARLRGGLERYDEGLADADAATKIVASYGIGTAVVSNCLLAAALAQDAGHRETELTRRRHALHEAELLEMPTTGIRYGLGRALVATDHPHEGVEILWQVLKDEEDAEVPPASRAETCSALAQGFEAAERYGNAVSMLEQAADLLEEAEQPVGAAEMLRRMSNILRGFEMSEEALEGLSRAWDLLEDQDADAMKVQVLEAWSFAKAQAGDAAAVDDIDRAIAIVRDDPEGPFDWKVADLIDSKARVLMDLERPDEAVATFLQAADGYAKAGDLTAAGRAEHFAAQLLAGPLERPAEAVPIWHEALDHAHTGLAQGQQTGSLRDSILLKLAEALETLGQSAEAAKVRSQVAAPPE